VQRGRWSFAVSLSALQAVDALRICLAELG
jgi:hypothetical protein